MKFLHTNKNKTIEVIPAILRRTFEGIQKDWDVVYKIADHIQIDVTDGVFAGEGTFREISFLKRLPESEKIELHMMVHTPANFLTDIIDLNPARCVFHIESFSGMQNLRMLYDKLRAATQSELGLAINPQSPNAWLEEYLDLINFVLFMSYDPGLANQPIDDTVYAKVAAFYGSHPDACIAIDGHVQQATLEPFVKNGATMLYANTAIFGTDNPQQSYLQLAAQAVMLGK